jgi:beta-lactamase regulating signal transducer with metallopeptidase domain
MFAELGLIGVEWWHVAGWTMVHFLWLGAIVGAAAGVLHLLLRRCSPNGRYVAALGTLGILSALPLGIAGWIVSTGPATQIAAMDEGSVGVRSEVGVERSEIVELANRPAVPVAESPIIELSTREPEPAQQSIEREAALERNVAGPQVDQPQVEDRPWRQEMTGVLQDVVAHLPWIWIVGTPLTFVLLATGLVGTRRLRSASRIIETGPIADACTRIARSLSVSRRVTLAVCERIAAPVLVGILRPMILLPPAAVMGWSPYEVEMVLLHELAHVRRWDNLVNLLQRLVESLLFFHPAVWLVSNWVRREREACCDSIVVGHTDQPQAYAEMLLAFAARVPRSALFAPAASAMAAGPLRGRIRQILKLEDDPMLVSGKSLALATFVLLVAVPLTVMNVPTGGEAAVSTTAGGIQEAAGRTADKTLGATKSSLIDLTRGADANGPSNLEKLRNAIDTGIDVSTLKPLVIPPSDENEAFQLFFTEVENNPLESKTYNVPDWWRKRDRLFHTFQGWQVDPYGPKVKFFTFWNADKSQVEVRAPRAAHTMIAALIAEASGEVGAPLEQPAQTNEGSATRPVRVQEENGQVVIFVPDSQRGEVVQMIDQLAPWATVRLRPNQVTVFGVDDVTLKNVAKVLKEKFATAPGQSPELAEWEKLIKQVPLVDAVIVDQMWSKLGLKVIPTMDKEDRNSEALREMYRQQGASADSVRGIKIVGGNLPDGLPVPCYLSDINGNGFEPFDAWLGRLENVGPAPHRCWATDAQGRTYVFETRPPEINPEDILGPAPAAAASNTPGPQTKSRFPSLDEQKLADLAWKALRLELRPLVEHELPRVREAGYDGGLMIESTAGPMINSGDILVGLHVWPTRNLRDVASVLRRDDLVELSPLKYYTLDKAGNISSGRISVVLEALPQIETTATPSPGIPPGAVPWQQRPGESADLPVGGPARQQAADGAGATDAQQKRALLRYEGKDFDAWRDSWRTELSAEKRLAAVMALTAFGRNGYGKEATETILEVVKQYDWSFIPDGSVGRLQYGIIAVFTGEMAIPMGQPRVTDVLPVQDWLPKLIGEIRSGNARMRQFAQYVLPYIPITEANKEVANKEIVPQLLALSVDDELKPERPLIVPSLAKYYILTHDKQVEQRLTTALKSGDIMEIFPALHALYWVSPNQIMYGGGAFTGPFGRGGFGGGGFGGGGESPPGQITTREFRPELIDALRTGGNEQFRHELLVTLHQIGPKAAPAVPHILPLTLEEPSSQPGIRFNISEDAQNAVRSITGSDQALVDYWKRAASDESLSPEKRALAERLLLIHQEREIQRRETDGKRSDKAPDSALENSRR